MSKSDTSDASPVGWALRVNGPCLDIEEDWRDHRAIPNLLSRWFVLPTCLQRCLLHGIAPGDATLGQRDMGSVDQRRLLLLRTRHDRVCHGYEFERVRGSEL